ncbi:MAG: sigma-54-dependent Fis family transcriptional regulator [Planctomycetes bacterium]|nr:sigma-54-dependent Fis family transcriptional regulator [Planctomycetota bacterium]
MNALAPPKDQLAILVIDDELIVRESLGAWLADDGYRVETAESGAAALRLASSTRYDVAFIDIQMPKMDGLELQKRLLAANPSMTTIVMTAYASVDTAVRALKEGAYDYIVKPFDPDELLHLVERARERCALQSENERLRQTLDAHAEPEELVGDSPAMKKLLEIVRTVGPTDTTVLVHGESGTGKELVARAIHASSPRRYAPLVCVHCGALAEGVLESELFGHEKGAFTGAAYHHKGKFEQADGGTIFLDEIGDISPKVQVELLRVLEEKRVTRVGGKTPIAVDFRVVAATHQDLSELVAQGRFREDLFYRLDVVRVEIPPLRERPGDVPVLARHFLHRLQTSMNKKDMHFSDAALEALAAHDWPGNVRELQNAVERAAVLGHPPELDVDDLPLDVRRAEAAPGAAARSLADVERRHIERVLAETEWNVTRAAAVLDVDRGTLYNKIAKYGLERPEHAR